MLSYEEALKIIHSKGNFSLPVGLERIKKLLDVLGNPQNKFKAIHIAGTNGKGSVASMTAEVLTASGYKVGLFTSPYIIEFRDRIRINGEFIPEESLARLTETVESTGVKVNEFEMITAIGFLYFAEEKCDVAVIETGLGGRYDATNTLDNVLVSVITKIGLDHTAILGDTIEKIAEEKCGIIKNSRTVTLHTQLPDAMAVIKKYSRDLTIPDTNRLKILKSGLQGNEFVYKERLYKTGLGGDFQIENTLAVIEAVEKSGLAVSYENLFEGIKNTRFPARLESFLGGRIILDGAHNPDGAGVLCRAMQSQKGDITAIVGMMKDKEYDSVLSLLLPHCKRVITVTAADMPRSLSAEELREYALKYCEDSKAFKTHREALSYALSFEDKIFVFGSLYLASSIRPLLLELV